jgi:hypothetical protein
MVLLGLAGLCPDRIEVSVPTFAHEASRLGAGGEAEFGSEPGDDHGAVGLFEEGEGLLLHTAHGGQADTFLGADFDGASLEAGIDAFGEEIVTDAAIVFADGEVIEGIDEEAFDDGADAFVGGFADDFGDASDGVFIKSQVFQGDGGAIGATDIIHEDIGIAVEEIIHPLLCFAMAVVGIEEIDGVLEEIAVAGADVWRAIRGLRPSWFRRPGWLWG